MAGAQAAMMRAKGYCTAAEAAGALGLHISNIYRAQDRGDVVGMQIGRNRYIRAASLVRYATKHDKAALTKLDALRKLAAAIERAQGDTVVKAGAG